jgi:hypothetical protein
MRRLFAAVAAVGVLAGCSGAAGAQPASTSASGSAITAELAKVKVVASRPNPPGYDRSCRKGHGCVFGPAWKDVDRNGCDTRNDVLAAQLTAVNLRDGSRCVVVAGELQDPYTGRAIHFAKAQASKVQIDHVYPLGRAWDMGAARWSAGRRTEFANDQAINLLAVDGKTNESKGDQGPGEWLPLNKAFRCAYVLRFLQVAVKYGLPVTRADADAAREIAPTCGGAR